MKYWESGGYNIPSEFTEGAVWVDIHCHWTLWHYQPQRHSTTSVTISITTSTTSSSSLSLCGVGVCNTARLKPWSQFRIRWFRIMRWNGVGITVWLWRVLTSGILFSCSFVGVACGLGVKSFPSQFPEIECIWVHPRMSNPYALTLTLTLTPPPNNALLAILDMYRHSGTLPHFARHSGTNSSHYTDKVMMDATDVNGLARSGS